MNESATTATENEEFFGNQGVDKVHQDTSLKGLSNDFLTPRSSSSTLCDTASNSSLSTSTSLASLSQESRGSKLPNTLDIDSDMRRFRYRKISPQKLLSLLRRVHGIRALHRVPLHLRDHHGCLFFFEARVNKRLLRKNGLGMERGCDCYPCKCLVHLFTRTK